MNSIYVSKAKELKVVDALYVFDGSCMGGGSKFEITEEHRFVYDGGAGYSVGFNYCDVWPFRRFEFASKGGEGFIFVLNDRLEVFWDWISRAYFYDLKSLSALKVSEFCEKKEVFEFLYGLSFRGGETICPVVFFCDDAEVVGLEGLMRDLYQSDFSKMRLLVKSLSFASCAVVFNMVFPASFVVVSNCEQGFSEAMAL